MNGQRSFQVIAKVLSIATATDEVYIIDGFCSGAPLSSHHLAPKFYLSNEEVETIAAEIRKDNVTLKIVRDSLQNTYSYNQIRLILAAMIRSEI